MATLFNVDFLKKSIDKYYTQEVRKIQQESNFQLVFTDDKVYNLDEIVLLRRRDVGNTPLSVHVIDKEDENGVDYYNTLLVFLAIDHILFNDDEEYPYIYEGQSYKRASKAYIGNNNVVYYKPYDKITDIPNYIALLQSVLDPDINPGLIAKFEDDIPEQIREKDGFIQINTKGDKNFFDILDIYDPDDVL